MYSKLMYCLVAFGPTIVIGLLGFRAALKRDNASWADYSDIAMVLGWVTAPLILVAAPLLHGPDGCSDVSSGAIGAAAIALFCLARASFSPENLSVTMLAKRVLAGSGFELGIGAYLLFFGLVGGLHPQRLIPSARLFMTVVWCSYLAELGVGALLRARSRMLGPGELLDRIREIADRRGARLEHILIIKSVPGYVQYVNAVAIHGTTIALFADLVAKLNKSEVDAVVEHEVGHIADERFWTLDSSLRFGCYLMMLALAYAAGKHITSLPAPWSSLVYAMWVAMFVLPEMLSRWYSRRAERIANENVAHLTEPLSAVSAFYKLALLNHYPVSRPLWSRLISTHPCVDEEVDGIARRTGLTDQQLRQAYERVEAEITGPRADAYELASAGSAVGELVPRPSRWATSGLPALCLLASIVAAGVFMFAVIVMVSQLPGGLAVIVGILGFIGCGLIIVLPVTVVNRRTQQRMAGLIYDHLEARYGADTVARSVAVDVLFPDWADCEYPWQGALLSVFNGQLLLLGEAAELRVGLDAGINVSRWADANSVGSEARMVRIAYRQDDALQTVLVKPLPRPDRGASMKWRQLEKHIKSLLTEAGADDTPLKEMRPTRPRKIKWSRVPLAVAVYLAILTTADYLARLMGAEDWKGRMMWFLIVTFAGGSGLWAWVTYAHKPDKD